MTFIHPWKFSFLLHCFGPLFATTSLNTMDNKESLVILEGVYDRLQRLKNKRFFFNDCRKLGILPKGVQLSFQLSLGVNEPVLVTEIEIILEKASSKIVDCLDKYCEQKEEEMENEFDQRREEVTGRQVTLMKRAVNEVVNTERQRLKRKLKSLKEQNLITVRMMEQCRGSRKIRAKYYRSRGRGEDQIAPERHPPFLRRHRRERRRGVERQQRRRRRRNERRRERRAERNLEDQLIVEEERLKRNPVNESSVHLTAAQVELTRLSAKFVPMDRKPVDIGEIMRGFDRLANNLRWAWFHDQRRRRMLLDGEVVEEEEEEDGFVMTPWYRRSARQAPLGNPQLEAGLDRLKSFILDPDNRRKVRDNLSVELRDAMEQLRNLPNTQGAQVVFEDKGSRFVVRDLVDQDNHMLEQLQNIAKFDELPADPAEAVKEKLKEFTQRWEEELNNFHPNIINFIMDVEDSNPGKVKGLIKVHKEVREDGKHPIRLLLTSCGTPVNPASKLLQMSISHIIPHLESNMRDTAAILRKISDINQEHPEGLPETTINLGCDVEAMYPSIDQEFGLQALEEHLRQHPNPDGLP